MTEPAGAMNAIRDVDELTEEEIEVVERILMILRGKRSRRTPRGADTSGVFLPIIDPLSIDRSVK